MARLMKNNYGVMKINLVDLKFVIPVLISILILSCKKDAGPLNPTQVSTGGLDKDGFARTDTSSILSVVRYITKLDTTYSASTIQVGWAKSLPDGDSLKAQWTIPSSFSYVPKFQKIWNQYDQKWSAQHFIVIDGKKSAGTGNVKVVLTDLKSNKNFTREQSISISHTDQTYDVFRVNFGMNKADVKLNEIERLQAPSSTDPGGWQETTPNNAYLYDGKSINELIGYEFLNDKLIAINFIKYHSTDVDTEYMYDDDRDEMIKLAKKRGVKTPTFQSKVIGGQLKYRTDDKVTWIQNGIKFTFGLRKMLILKNAVNYYALTYEKAN